MSDVKEEMKDGTRFLAQTTWWSMEEVWGQINSARGLLNLRYLWDIQVGISIWQVVIDLTWGRVQPGDTWLSSSIEAMGVDETAYKGHEEGYGQKP